MHLSKTIDAKEAPLRVLQFEPPRFDLGIPGVALEALERQSQSKGFEMSELIRRQTGLKELEAQSVEEEIERRALEKLKDVQESAYKQAYDLGLDEGRKEAFRNSSREIEERLGHLDKLLGSIENLKAELVNQNESHLVQLAFHMAKRLAAHEVEANQEATLNIIRQAIEIAQTEEYITVKVNPEQLEFIETLRKENARQFEYMKKARLEADPEVGRGGCIVITNYGEIDSRFDERINQLWETLGAHLVKVKEELKSVS